MGGLVRVVTWSRSSCGRSRILLLGLSWLDSLTFLKDSVGESIASVDGDAIVALNRGGKMGF